MTSAPQIAARTTQQCQNRDACSGYYPSDPKTLAKLYKSPDECRQRTREAVLLEAFGPDGIKPGNWDHRWTRPLFQILAAADSDKNKWLGLREEIDLLRGFAIEMIRFQCLEDPHAAIDSTTEIKSDLQIGDTLLSAVLIAYFAGSNDLLFGVADDDGRVEYLFLSKLIADSVNEVNRVFVHPSDEHHPLALLIASKTWLEPGGFKLNAASRTDMAQRKVIAESLRPWVDVMYPQIHRTWPEMSRPVLNALTLSSLLEHPDFSQVTLDLLVATVYSRSRTTEQRPNDIVNSALGSVGDWESDRHPCRSEGVDRDLDPWRRWFESQDQEKLAREAIEQVRRRTHRRPAPPPPRGPKFTTFTALLTLGVLALGLLRSGLDSSRDDIDAMYRSADVGVMRQAAHEPETLLSIDGSIASPEGSSGAFQNVDVGVMLQFADIGVMGSITLA